MKWKISWSDQAMRSLSKLERSEASRIVKKLEQSAANPERSLSKLVGYDDYKLRVGDYRVIVLLLHSEKTIFIEELGHRKNIYK